MEKREIVFWLVAVVGLVLLATFAPAIPHGQVTVSPTDQLIVVQVPYKTEHTNEGLVQFVTLRGAQEPWSYLDREMVEVLNAEADVPFQRLYRRELAVADQREWDRQRQIAVHRWSQK